MANRIATDNAKAIDAFVAAKREIDVMSYGADGQQGGEGFDADLGSWML